MKLNLKNNVINLHTLLLLINVKLT